MSNLRDLLNEEPPDGSTVQGTPKQRLVWDIAMQNWNQTQSEVAEQVKELSPDGSCDSSYVSYILERTTPEMLEAYKRNRTEQSEKVAEPAGRSKNGDTHIYIFSDMSAEEIRDFLKV